MLVEVENQQSVCSELQRSSKKEWTSSGKMILFWKKVTCVFSNLGLFLVSWWHQMFCLGRSSSLPDSSSRMVSIPLERIRVLLGALDPMRIMELWWMWTRVSFEHSAFLLVCVRLHTFNYGHFKDGGRRVFKDFVVEKVLGRVYILYCWNEVYRKKNFLHDLYLRTQILI